MHKNSQQHENTHAQISATETRILTAGDRVSSLRVIVQISYRGSGDGGDASVPSRREDGRVHLGALPGALPGGVARLQAGRDR